MSHKLNRCLVFSICALSLMNLACTPNSRTTDSSVAKQLDKIEHEIQSLRSQMRAPAGQEFRERLQELEAGLLNATSDASKISNEFSQVRNSMPVLAAIELSAPIAAVEWLLQMEKLLRNDESVKSLSDAEALFEDVPESIDAATAQNYSRRHAKNVITYCQSISNAEELDINDLEIAGEMLGRLDANGTPNPAVEVLKSTLASKLNGVRSKTLLAAVQNDAAAIDSHLAKALAINDIELRHSVLVSLNQSLDNLRVQLALQGHFSELNATKSSKEKITLHLEQAFAAIAERQQGALKTAKMRYQTWTLQEIEKLNSFLDPAAIDKELYRLRDESAKSSDPVVIRWLDFKGVRAMFEKSLGELAANFQLSSEQQTKVGPFVKANWYEIIYQVKHDAVVRHLLHIEQGLLEPAVAKFYNEAFEKQWKELQDRPALQLSMARMSAEVPKRGLEKFTKE